MTLNEESSEGNRYVQLENTDTLPIALLEYLLSNDTVTLSNRTKTTVQVNITTYPEGLLDVWDIRQKTVNGTLLEQFYGTHILGEGNFELAGGGYQ